MSTLRDELLAAHDPFLFVVECVALYKSVQEFDVASATLLDACDMLPQGIRDRVHLGIIYAKRLHSNEDSERLIAETLVVARRATRDGELQLIASLVEAVILLMRRTEFAESITKLEALQTELCRMPPTPLYALVRRAIATAYSYVGRHKDADDAYNDASSITRRYKLRFSYACTLNDQGTLKRKIGQQLLAKELIREALSLFRSLGVTRHTILADVNLGILSEYMGEFAVAERHYDRALRRRECYGTGDRLDTALSSACLTNLEYLQIRRREFDKARHGLERIVALGENPQLPRRVVAIALQFLGELETAVGNGERAEKHLAAAYALIADILPESDMMTDVLRRQAQLLLTRGRVSEARQTALRSIALCRRIGERVELGIAVRVLGESYVALGLEAKARSCFDLAIRVLKGANEVPELMLTLYVQGRFLANGRDCGVAESCLHEAWHLSERLRVHYHSALICIGLTDLLRHQGRLDEAASWLGSATSFRKNIEGADRSRIDAELDRAATQLQTAITRASVKSAETLKTICRVYEDARFPIAEIKPDLAYQVAQSVGGESLWVIGRKGSGFHVPITYNISTNEAKSVTRELDRRQFKALLDVESEPKVFATSGGRTLVAAPCRDMDGRTNGYATCVRFETIVSILPRQVEILCASADALSRLIEDEDERKAVPQADADDEPVRIRHPRGSFKDVLTIDPEMIKLIRLAERAATSVAPILLEGETGVGKELFARALHASSQRKNGPFVAVNAGGMSVSLLESELFGHVKGAFTDARSERLGLVEMAREGTLFLDEIGEMGEEMQVKLLRLLENGEYRRLGESNTRKADVRVISATNRDLKRQVDNGKFRQDLYYRVSPVKLTIPPLRMRSRDIQLMVRHFLRECAAMNGIADRFIEIDVKAMEALELYDWPGNVRELHNEILRVVSLIGKGDLVRFSMLSPSIKDYLQTKKRSEGLLERSVEQYERRLILRALESNEWNRMQTADAIGIPRTTLIAKLKRLNVASK